MAAAHQLALYEGDTVRARPSHHGTRPARKLCAACWEKEARYGFGDDPEIERPRTLCFGCFRTALMRRQRAAARLGPGRTAGQPNPPLQDLLEDATRRRRRAQIAARHALGL